MVVTPVDDSISTEEITSSESHTPSTTEGKESLVITVKKRSLPYFFMNSEPKNDGASSKSHKKKRVNKRKGSGDVSGSSSSDNAGTDSDSETDIEAFERKFTSRLDTHVEDLLYIAEELEKKYSKFERPDCTIRSDLENTIHDMKQTRKLVIEACDALNKD